MLPISEQLDTEPAENPPAAIDSESRLVGELRHAIERRRIAEEELAELEADDESAASHAEREALSERIAGLEAEITDREQWFLSAREESNARYEADTSAAELEFRRVSTEIARDTEERTEVVEGKYEENQWMLGSLLDDDGEHSPKRHYDDLNSQLRAARDQLAERAATLQSRYEVARDIAESRRINAGGLPEAGAPVAGTRREAMIAFEAGEKDVLANAEELQRQVFARLITPATLAIVFVVLGTITFVAMKYGISPGSVGLEQVRPRLWLMLSGGAGLAVGLIVVVILHAVARKQTLDALSPLQQGMARSQQAHAAWMALAKDELQRQEQAYRAQQESLVTRRQAARQQFENERQEGLTRIESERKSALEAPTRERENRLREAGRRREADQGGIAEEHRAAVAAAREMIDREKHDFEQKRQRRIADARATRSEHLRVMTGDWNATIADLETKIATVCQADDRYPADWLSILDSSWTLPEELPDGIRIGDYRLELGRLRGGIPKHPALADTPQQFHWPARLAFPGNPSLCLKAPLAGRASALAILQVAMLRLLTQLPPGKVRFTILDPIGLGESFSAFMHLADFDELLISSRIWTEPTQIDEQLAGLTDHMESVFQKYLRGEYESIEDYNHEAGEVAEPYRILVVAAFPNGFSDRAAERLGSILASGARCGVFPLIIADPGQRTPMRFEPDRLDDAGCVLEWADREFVLKSSDGVVALEPDAPPPAAEFAAIVRKVGEASKYVRRVEVPFRRVIPTEADYWSGDSRRGLEAPLGRAGARRLQSFHLGTGTSQHALIAGKTGSGKSTLLHVLVTNLALRYGPDELNFYLVDFKKGVEFKVYATSGLPHARVIAIESDREFAVSVLERLGEILRQRGERFREAGVQDIGAFRDAHPGEAMPRILLIVDEFQEFFTQDDRHAQSASLLLDRLVRQGRAFGMHVLLGSQTLGGAYSLARSTMGQMAVRIALQCSEADAHLILSEDNTAARLLTRPGEAIYNDANGMLEGNSPFQIAWLSDEQQRAALESVAQLARERGLEMSPPIVFEGNIPADPAGNRELTERVQRVGQLEDMGPLTAWLGESVAITGPTEVTLASRSGANLLLVGPDEASARGVITAAVASFAADEPSTDDESLPMVSLLTPYNDVDGNSPWDTLERALAGRLRLGGSGDVAEFVGELANELEQRKDGRENRAARLLIIDDLGRFRDLRKSDDEFSFGGFDRDQTPSVSKQFATILRDGPALGIHVVCWCDTFNNVNRSLGRQLLREFELRVAFQMSPADSSNLIDSAAAGRLGANRALLYRDDRGTVEKFRPYRVSDPWLAWAGQFFGGKVGAIEESSEDESPDVEIEEAGEQELDTWTIT